MAQEAPSGRRHAAAGREDHARNHCVIPVKSSSQGATTRGRVYGSAWSRAFPRCLQAEEPCAWSKSGVTTAWSRALPQGRCCCFPTASCVKKRETISACTDPENAKKVKEFACRPKIKIARAVWDRPNCCFHCSTTSGVPASVGWNCRTMKVVVAPWPCGPWSSVTAMSAMAYSLSSRVLAPSGLSVLITC